MKIAFIFDTFLVKRNDNNYYGMTLTYDFFKERYLSMFDSVVVTTRVKLENKSNSATSGYKIVNGDNVEVRPIEDYVSIPDAIINKKKITQSLKKVINDVDKVIIRMPSVLGIMAAKICEKEKKNYLIEMVACPWDGYINHTNCVGKIIAPVMYFETRKVVKKCDNVLYVTEKFLQKRYPTYGSQVSCSDVVLDNVDNNVLQKRKEMISKCNIKELSLVTVANVGMKYKGHIYVFKAIADLKKNGYNFKYYLIGNGSQERLKKIAKKLCISDNIVFVGSLPHDRVFEFLKKMDLYIQPSLQEGLPRALIEAMSLGMPAIGSNAGGIPELLNEKMIFKKKNVFELEKILTNLTLELLYQNSDFNYKKSLEYDYNHLNEKRKSFYLGDV